jgi:phosphatidylinositol alpha-mannosyltransferase
MNGEIHPMRVLFLTNSDVAYGGVAEVLLQLGRSLHAHGVQVRVCSGHESAGAGRLADDVPCFCLPLPKPGLFHASREATRGVAALCREQGIDLIHTHGLYRAGWAGRLVWRATGIPYLVTSHGDVMVGVSARLRRWRVRRRCRAVVRDAAAVTHLNGFMEQCAAKLDDLGGKSWVIPNGIDLAWWRRPTVPVGGTYVLAVGRLARHKGFDVLLAAAARLRARGRAVSLVIVGDGEMHGPLAARAAELGLPLCRDPEQMAAAAPGTVCLPGWVEPVMKRRLFAGCTVFAFPSQPAEAESFGLVQLEAMAAAKPMVASDIPASRSLLKDGVNATLVAPADAEAWASALAELLGDPRRRQRYADVSVAEVEQYDWGAVAGRYADVYRAVLEERARARPANACTSTGGR